MTQTEDRRADSTRRIPVEALVEVCGVGSARQAPFEAESADLSGRGIRLKTAYLPEPGAQVVCRFENGGQEVIAEGVVAWCQKETRGGEFGVRFTALDARSAEVLKELCGIGECDPSAPPPDCDVSEQEYRCVAKGSKVKLHIEGLGSPMRARVDEGGDGQRIAVGSTLEFLRLGRKLEMESLDDGTRREARIDGLDVSIDPATGVPRLLVLLKTDSRETTPQPSVVDTAKRTTTKTATHQPKFASTVQSKTPSTKESLEATAANRESLSQEAIDEQVELMVGRMRRIAGSARRKMSEVKVQLGSRIAPTMGRAVQSMRRMSERGQEPARRRTAPAPAQAPNAAERQLRPQNRAAQSSQPEVKTEKFYLQPKVKRTAGVVAAIGLLATVIAVAARSPETKLVASAEPQLVTNQGAVAAQPQAGSAIPAKAGQTPPVGANGQPQTGLVAQVPLFGPTPMATLEAVPLPAPAAESPEVIAARELALAKASQAAAASGTDSLSEEPGGEGDAKDASATKPEDVPAWGKGRMKEPTLYRIKLDEAGSAIKGTTQSKGFSVIVPGRKAMESPKGFVSRDPRFAKISAQSTTEGVKLTWTFKEEVPGYRVRLRKNNVEVLISEGAKSGKGN